MHVATHACLMDYSNSKSNNTAAHLIELTATLPYYMIFDKNINKTIVIIHQSLNDVANYSMCIVVEVIVSVLCIYKEKIIFTKCEIV